MHDRLPRHRRRTLMRRLACLIVGHEGYPVVNFDNDTLDFGVTWRCVHCHR